MTTLVRGTRYVYWGLAWLFVLGVLAQVFFIGMTLFAGYGMLPVHVGFGHLIVTLVLLMVILMYVAKLPRPTKIRVWVLFGVLIVQAEVFAAIHRTMPIPASFHPVLALIIFWLAMTIALEARALTQETAAPAASGG